MRGSTWHWEQPSRGFVPQIKSHFLNLQESFFVLYNLHNFYGKGLSVKDVAFLHPQGGYSSCFMISEHAYMRNTFHNVHAYIMRMRRFSCDRRPKRALQADRGRTPHLHASRALQADRARTHLHAHVECTR